MVQSDINQIVVGQSVLAPRMPLAAPDDLEEGVIASVGKRFARVMFSEKDEGVYKRKSAATVVTMRLELIRQR
jgi:hypothetical protein